MKKTTAKNQKPTVQLATVAEARGFFAGELRQLMDKRRIDVQQDSFNYLVELMLRFMESDSFFAKNAEGKPVDHFLIGLYSEYVNGSPEQRHLSLRRLGDICLMVTGFFPDSLNRKLVDVDYYSGMGGAAYWQLSQAQMAGPLFRELAVKFRAFSEVLGELSERSGLQTNQDLLRLYEKWIYSGSDRLKELLNERGIGAPVRFDIKTRH